MLVIVSCSFALGVAGLAAYDDWRTGEIANWITLPSVGAALVAYACFAGSPHALGSVASLLLCSTVPYALFRLGAMGGGDVKLFAALGAATGYDLRVGLEMQLAAFIVAAAFVVCLWVVHLLTSTHSEFSALQEVRLGLPILIGTAWVVLPELASSGAFR